MLSKIQNSVKLVSLKSSMIKVFAKPTNEVGRLHQNFEECLV